MNDTAKTTAFLAISVALLGTALWASIPRSNSVDDFRDLGQPFFPEFTDPALCTSLEVFELDPTTAQAREFAIKQRDGRWVIPSHNNYPADGKERLAKTAAQVIGLTKDTIRSSRSEDHEALGVLDPNDAKVANMDGAGKRITLRDSSDRVLADYILGKTVPNRPGQRYVRRPGQVRTYGVNADVETSTRFADWIEPNLLDLQGSSVVQATFDNSKWDPDFERLSEVAEITARREADGAPWTMTGLSPNEEVSPEKTSAMIQALSDLKIVGVRPKPQILIESLENPGTRKIDRVTYISLMSHGFRLSQNGQLMPEEGTVRVTCSDGISYSLRFGKVTFARGEALSGGKPEDAAKAKAAPNPADSKKTSPKGEGGVESRYLFVTAGFDPKSLPPPKNSTAPLAAGRLPYYAFRRSAAEIRAATDRERAQVEAWRARIESGRARAETLTKRFAPWYFVVPGDDYRSILLDRASLVQAKAPPGAAAPRNPLGGAGMRLPNAPRSIPVQPNH
jgi:Domain of unknown function (DUF4340)